MSSESGERRPVALKSWCWGPSTISLTNLGSIHGFSRLVPAGFGASEVGTQIKSGWSFLDDPVHLPPTMLPRLSRSSS